MVRFSNAVVGRKSVQHSFALVPLLRISMEIKSDTRLCEFAVFRTRIWWPSEYGSRFFIKKTYRYRYKWRAPDNREIPVSNIFQLAPFASNYSKVLFLNNYRYHFLTVQQM